MPTLNDEIDLDAAEEALKWWAHESIPNKAKIASRVCYNILRWMSELHTLVNLHRRYPKDV